MTNRLRNLPVELPVTPPAGFEVWQLEGSVDGNVWEPINAGHVDTPVRGRFYSDQTVYRVLWASHAGSTSATLPTPVPGSRIAVTGPGSRRIPGRDF